MSDYSEPDNHSQSLSVRHQQAVSDKDTMHYRHGRKELPAACRLEALRGRGGGGGDGSAKVGVGVGVEGEGGGHSTAHPPSSDRWGVPIGVSMCVFCPIIMQQCKIISCGGAQTLWQLFRPRVTVLGPCYMTSLLGRLAFCMTMPFAKGVRSWDTWGRAVASEKVVCGGVSWGVVQSPVIFQFWRAFTKAWDTK